MADIDREFASYAVSRVIESLLTDPPGGDRIIEGLQRRGWDVVPLNQEPTEAPRSAVAFDPERLTGTVTAAGGGLVTIAVDDDGVNVRQPRFIGRSASVEFGPAVPDVCPHCGVRQADASFLRHDDWPASIERCARSHR